MLKRIVIITLLLTSYFINADAKIEGTHNEVKKLLENIPEIVSIEVEDKLTLESTTAKATFVIHSEEDKLSEAIHSANTVYSNVNQKIQNLGLPAKNITTAPYAIIPQFSFYKKEPSSYSVQKSFTVEINSEKDFLLVLTITEKIKDLRFVKIEPIRDNLSDAKEKLEMKCLQLLNKKKLLYENALDVKLIISKFSLPQTQIKAPQVFHNFATSVKNNKSFSSVNLPQPRSNFGKFTIHYSIKAFYKLYPKT